MDELNEFNSTKNALLKYHSNIQSSLGTRLFAFSVLLFTLFQISSWNNNQGLTAIIGSTSTIYSSFKLTLFFLAIYVIFVYIVRTIFRYASMSGICNWLIVILPLSNPAKSLHSSILADVYQKMICYNTKIFGIFPSYWFISGVLCDDEELSGRWNKKSICYGWITSGVIGFFILSCFLLIYSNILF